MGGHKREIEIIDLEDENYSPKRRAITPSTPYYANGTPSSSRASPANGTSRKASQGPQSSPIIIDDEEILDLTQEPEGPEKELYGTLGELRYLLYIAGLTNFYSQRTRLLVYAITMVSLAPVRSQSAIENLVMRFEKRNAHSNEHKIC